MTRTADLKTLYRSRVTQRRRLTFPAILGDPLVRDLMRADGVKPATLKSELARIADYLKLSPRADAEPCPAC